MRNRGAGPLELPRFRIAQFGKVTLAPGASQSIPFDLTGLEVTRLEVAIWWPDFRMPITGAFVHSQINLELALPGQSATTWSRDPSSVFQRATATIGATGRTTWNVNLDGSGIASQVPAQDVYYVIVAQ